MNTERRLRLLPRAGRALALAALLAAGPTQATTLLADQPVFTNTAVPGNLALAISVEFPTVINAAYQANFVPGTQYLGYFDAKKCYRYYQGNSAHDAGPTAGDDVSHFFPVGSATNDFKCTASGLTDTWSGSFLNWLTMQSIDSFRWALTGGYRRVDTTSTTILERAWSSNQGGEANFYVVGSTSRPSPSATAIAEHTPLSWADIRVGVRTRGNQVLFTRTGTLNSGEPPTGLATHYSQTLAVADATVYRVYARVKVCDNNTTAAGPLEGNCTAYPSGTYKPTGLIHQYSDRFRYSAFGYLTDGSFDDNNLRRDGGVLRAPQKFVGPLNYTPGAAPAINSAREWDPDTGIFFTNPNPTDATTANTFLGLSGADAIVQSGVMNYLNKFGQTFQDNHKTFDPVGELYYAAVRYFKALGNVPEWTDQGSANTATKRSRADGFPVITSWNDPIQYSCQRNFILGIGDVNSHADKNVPGTGIGTSNEPARPSTLALDPVNAKTATDKVGALHGLGATLGSSENYGDCCNNNSALMAGIAYDANTQDIRPDMPGKQTIQTYWLDVLEFGVYKNNNQFYLAAKYGGFRVPDSFDAYGRTTDIPEDLWYTTTDLTPGGQRRPDNYYTAAQPDQMIAGLTRAFENIAASLKAYTTSFATSLPQTALVGNISYGAQYDSSNWSGEVQANTVSFDATTGTPSLTLQWQFSTKLAAQIAESGGTGWDISRRIATWQLTTAATGGAGPAGGGKPFRHASLSAAQKTALNTTYRTGDDSADYLNYLRGDKTHEESSTAAGSARIYRNRTNPVGDIVGSRVRPVGAPAAPFADATNPGYGAFKTAQASRPTVVYVGTNAGLLHAIDGVVTGSAAGRERFAYVPDMLFQDSNTLGLRSRGDPEFAHKPLVDGSPAAFDLDFSRTQNNARTGVLGGSNDWRTILVGGMGKGGRGYFALDITDPASMTTEALVTGKVLWEISSAHPDFAELGYTYGEPTAVKTRKWGWVLIFASGYNNSDGKGWFFIVNPRNGALLEKISTGEGTAAAQAGMAHLQSYIVDRTDGTADAVYAGDLLGNLWRWDLRATSGNYPAPVKIAQLTNAASEAQPVTSRPLVLVHPPTNRRYIAVGTGRLLDNSDITNTSAQAFHAVIDGTGYTFATTGPGGAAFPITRAQMVEHTNLTMPVVVDPATKGGWWVNLGVTSGNGWRVITEPSGFYGVVTFTAMLPSTSPCNPSGVSRVYSVDIGTGKSQLINDTDTTIAYSDVLSGVVIEHRTYSVQGKPRLVACNDLGTCSGLRRSPAGAVGLKRLNWRELPLAD
jgi:type IV pilus assembly protein PilY1